MSIPNTGRIILRGELCNSTVTNDIHLWYCYVCVPTNSMLNREYKYPLTIHIIMI